MTAFIIAKNTTYSLIKDFLGLFEKNQFNLLKKQQTNEAIKKLALNKEWKIQIGIPGTVANRKYSSSLLLLGWVKQLYEILRLEANIRYQLLKKLRRIWFFLKLRKYREKFKFFRSRYNEIEIDYPKEERVSIYEALANEKLIMEKYKELNAIKLLICNLIKLTTESRQEYDQLLEQYAKENSRLNQINTNAIVQAIRQKVTEKNFTLDDKTLEERLLKLNKAASELSAIGINLPLAEDPYAIQQIDEKIIKQQAVLQQIEVLISITETKQEKLHLTLEQEINLINATTATLFKTQTTEKIAKNCQQAYEGIALAKEIETYNRMIKELQVKVLDIESFINKMDDFTKTVPTINLNNSFSVSQGGTC